ncbi:hypothetical protein [Streptomyces spiralis]
MDEDVLGLARPPLGMGFKEQQAEPDTQQAEPDTRPAQTAAAGR